eukprot:CAMPEP_0115533090 /NCGR_PEP_ID=MMETSP0271-20121206/85931_1 /TAXON_ID=71861 /ORGANISM="Scrippsiella trochoidea, Strain CCMP3099" /LENGTH=87 /DNA_ID=CAMNT_0002965439 /DNA_START=372 /DNA_END=631 /DNA_ORIENTATION=+
MTGDVVAEAAKGAELVFTPPNSCSSKRAIAIGSTHLRCTPNRLQHSLGTSISSKRESSGLSDSLGTLEARVESKTRKAQAGTLATET